MTPKSSVPMTTSPAIANSVALTIVAHNNLPENKVAAIQFQEVRYMDEATNQIVAFPKQVLGLIETQENLQSFITALIKIEAELYPQPAVKEIKSGGGASRIILPKGVIN